MIKNNSEDYIITSILNFGQNSCWQTLKFDDESEKVLDRFWTRSHQRRSSTFFSLQRSEIWDRKELMDFAIQYKLYVKRRSIFAWKNRYKKWQLCHSNTFACRNIEEATIPSNIKIISSFAFCSYKELETVEFESNSELQIIDEIAFKCSRIKEIKIPKSVVEIEKIFFPEHLTKVGMNCFEDSKELKIIGISPKKTNIC